MRMVSAGLTLGRTKGNGLRAMSGPKKRQPKRSFSITQSLPLMGLGRKKDIGWPNPARRRPASTTKRNSTGPSTIAARRKHQRRAPGMDAAEALPEVADADELLERDGCISDAASPDLSPGSAP